MPYNDDLPHILKNERDRLGSLADAIGAGIVVIDRDYEVLWMNERVMQWLNTPEPPEKTLCHEIFYKRDKPCPDCALEKCVRTGEVAQKETQAVFADKQSRHFLITCAPIHDEKGDIAYVIELVQDVSESRLSQEKQQFWQEYFMKVIYNAPVGILTTDPSGVVFSWNKYLADMYGIPETGVLGLNLFDRFPVLLMEGLDRKVNEVIRSKQPMFLFDYRHGGKPGEPILMDLTIYPLLTESNEAAGVSFIVHDITERNSMLKELEQARDFLARMFHTVTDFVFIVAFDGEIIDINPATSSVFLYEKIELAKKSLSTVFQTKEEYSSFMLDMMKHEKLENQEYELIDRDNNIHRVILSASIMNTPGGSPDVIAIIGKDVTDLMQIHEKFMRAQRLNALGELASGVAHDFNNLLAVILGRAQMMIKHTQDPMQLKNLEVIERAARHGSESIKRIQSFAKKQSEKDLFNKIDLNSILNEAIEFTRPSWRNEARSRGAVVNISFTPSEDCYAFGNYHELLEVFTNLILNAVDAMHHGGDLAITSSCRDGSALVTFSDTGVGMPPDVKQKIFDPFYTTKGMKGTGLGLSVSYGIVERHGGSIEVFSEVGRGTTFWVRLPQNPKPDEDKSPGSENAKILVVEDDRDVLDLIVEILESKGYNVKTEANGTDAISRLSQEKFDVVMTDLVMEHAGPSGLDVINAARSSHPRAVTALVTAWASRVTDEDIKRCGVDFLIPKPFHETDILNVLSPNRPGPVTQ